jgi:hypothetical protein
MRNFVVLLRVAAPLMLSAATIDIASAASPAYCALYAREYAISRIGPEGNASAASALQRVQDQAYYRCLNQDDEPEFPTTSAYFGAAVEDIFGDNATDVGGPFQDVGEGDASAGDETPIEPAPVVKPKAKPKKLASQGSGRGSGLTPWSDEWVTWCKSNYRSFNATTGFVLTLSGERKLCP